MKHLKLLEGYFDKYYEELTYDKWVEITEQNNEDFSDKDKSKLEILLKECDNIVIFKWGNKILQIKTSKSYIYIESLVDDYYLVWIDYGISDWYFKCDQFEGLVKLLKDRGILSK